ncbi:hypothetical protein A2313_03200 [Candidatus Roizmanbacteria bacterium RIFOXYB2_FULL_41_10]|uniref:Uncharacterized protein n=1 Tax=Candidatus Roizmanbacteria bacterium RIFOXYA1_FULL_41_12 TaxID=1802082 RepID=A0A1F7K9V4_9BACT|nr:MAG: hypothetical protein A2262_02885 [Candidatus Roizmanbacteria bacterium RIFOXYA2_FULL_41_8]OGK64647.1 MAG: hypothetical protein A2209_03600 [Candidatus Roizmanbacteria bacterium RIFOXYA1_FULL_41_12]OGK67193.1 MAG: hypothetical protein A2377_00980 [Candidatus Roizmanbacteria bacterium RIFOXYB1_FULL_41_27]OGK72255.1 MAG: hypothetical protein A2313_03200 [Candidatus Roizmanbacteria bacterium RIFOXYB2_FULL_41_10]OGK72447.1 MAG: hypothetical protein A2403_02985 [Candidatus Roizmanbacteria bac
MPTKTLTIISTYQLSEAEIKTILTSLGLQKSATLLVDNQIDKGIIAGIVIKYNDYYLDLSLKNKLREIVGNLS